MIETKSTTNYEKQPKYWKNRTKYHQYIGRCWPKFWRKYCESAARAYEEEWWQKNRQKTIDFFRNCQFIVDKLVNNWRFIQKNHR